MNTCLSVWKDRKMSHPIPKQQRFLPCSRLRRVGIIWYLHKPMKFCSTITNLWPFFSYTVSDDVPIDHINFLFWKSSKTSNLSQGWIFLLPDIVSSSPILPSFREQSRETREDKRAIFSKDLSTGG